MIRWIPMVALMFGAAFGQTEGQVADEESKAEQPEIEVSRPSAVRFGGFWLGGSGGFAGGREFYPAYCLARR